MGGARTRLVLGLLRDALHRRRDRVALDVVLLQLRLRADVGDDLNESRGRGTGTGTGETAV